MSENTYKRIYFAGAGGIGMAALERYFLSRGLQVAGYDRTPSELTRRLAEEGVEMSYSDSMDAVPQAYRNPADTLVVYTPAVPDSNVPLSYFRRSGFRVIKRSEALGIITRGSKAICFAGTHGKTTTSSLCAHILHSGPSGCNAFLGGILRNYGSNLLLSESSPYSVVEADEYDRSFHRLTPYIAVITATDPDHLDIYGTEEAYLESFAHFTELMRPDGKLLLHTGLKLHPRQPDSVEVYTYSRNEGDYHAENVVAADGTIHFDFVYPGGRIDGIELGVPVDINVENAVAALAACHLAGELHAESAAEAVASFLGPERRFQFHLKQSGPEGKVIIDDYAHHPAELARSIASVRALYPGRRLTVAFQPHLYSRTRDFAGDFAHALSQADDVVLTDIYPARELPIEGVSSQIIFDKIKNTEKTLICKEDFVKTIKNRNFEILLVAGAGDLNLSIPELVENYR